MAKYRLSEGFMSNFWSWIGRKKPTTLQQVIDKDPVLKKIDKDLAQIASTYKPYLRQKREEDPQFWKKLVDVGLITDKDID